MTFPTINITGQALPPNSTAVGGSIRFRLSGPDIDTGTSIVVPREIIVPLDDGAVDVDLWPTERGQTPNGRMYTVDVSLEPASPNSRRAWVSLGEASLPASPLSRDLGEWLAENVSTVPITPAILQQAIAARDAAQRAQSVASISEKTADYTLQDSDKGTLIASAGASDVAVTIPTDATGGFTEAVVISFLQTGTGALSLAAASGVTLNGMAEGQTSIQQRWGAAQVIRLSADAWSIVGLTDEVAA